MNLLVALDVLLVERSISRAAERLNMSPSAMSSALGRLRDYFDDELLVQVGRKMEPTPRAEGLHDAVRDVLLRVDSTIATQPDFVASETNRTFRIFASDYSQTVLVPLMLSVAAEMRSRARFELLPHVSNPQRALERGEADLLIIPRGLVSAEHPVEVLYEERFVAVMWSNSPLAQSELTIERYLNAEHVVMQPPGPERDTSYEAGSVKRLDYSRSIAVTTYSFSVMPALVVGTEYIATVHERLARAMRRVWPLEVRDVPFAIPPMEEAIQWHKYRTQDPGLVWLRCVIQEAVKRLDRG
ncbi:LysR family transcriptional regulator [Paraburkholderia sp. A1RO-5L]|uniref:LysR family transcriptional regulator n=1 Tax=unclassified Paraburkholderia TaxID=2615204 RepID=UPI003B98373B